MTKITCLWLPIRLLLILLTVGLALPALHAETATTVPRRVPGDLNEDGVANLTDAINLLGYLYLGDTTRRVAIEQRGLGYMDPSDRVDLADVITLLTYLYRAGPQPVVTLQVASEGGRVHRDLRDAFTFRLNEGYVEVAWTAEAGFDTSQARAMTVHLHHTEGNLELPAVEATGPRSVRVRALPSAEFGGAFTVSFSAELHGRLPVHAGGPQIELPAFDPEAYPLRFSPIFGETGRDISGTVRLLQDRVVPDGLFEIAGPCSRFDELQVVFVPVPTLTALHATPYTVLQTKLQIDSELRDSALFEQSSFRVLRGDGAGAAVRHITIGRVIILQAPTLIIAGALFRIYIFCPRGSLPPLFADAGVIMVSELPSLCARLRGSRPTVVRRGLRYIDFSRDVTAPSPAVVAPGGTFEIHSETAELKFNVPQGYLRVVLQDQDATGSFGETAIRLTQVQVFNNGSAIRVLVPPSRVLAGRSFGVSIFGDDLFCPPWFAAAGTISVVQPGEVPNLPSIQIGGATYRDHSRNTTLTPAVVDPPHPSSVTAGQVQIRSTSHAFDLSREVIRVRLTDQNRPHIVYAVQFLRTFGGVLQFYVPAFAALRGGTFRVEVLAYPFGGGTPIYALAGILRVRR